MKMKNQTIINWVNYNICQNYGISETELKSKNRKREIVEARQVCMFLLHKHTDMTFEKIGSEYGKDHATVLHTKKTLQNRIDTEPLFKQKFAQLNNMLYMFICTFRNKKTMNEKRMALLNVLYVRHQKVKRYRFSHAV